MPYTLTRLTSNTICVDSLLIDDPVEVQTLTHAMLQAHADGFIEITPPPGSAEIGPPGPPGTPGQGFTIAKVYSSVAALTADVAPTGINSGEFAIIDTGDVENPENSRIYVWNGSTYSYVNDLSGEMGIQGFQGLPGTAGAQGEAGDPKVLATQAEAEAGTDNSAYMSPLRNMQALKAQLIAGGNITLTPQAGGVEITASASGSTTFIYAPSKTQAGNVFNNWGDLTTHIAAMPDGEIPTVIFTESCTLPVGTYNMKLGKWASSTMSTGAITVTLPDGMLIQNLCYIQDGLQVNVEPTTADGVFVNTLFGGFNILVIGLGAKLVNLGTKAAIVTDGFLVVAQFFATIAVTPYSTAPWVKCLDGHTVQAMILGNLVFSQFEEDWVVGGGTTGNLLYFHGDSFAVPPLTQWTGNPPTYINSAKAEMVQYFDSFEPSVTTGATQVQQAIDWLKVNSLRDAPSDTKLYGRKDGAWAEVTGGGGSGPIMGLNGSRPDMWDAPIYGGSNVDTVLNGVQTVYLRNTMTPVSTTDGEIVLMFGQTDKATRGIYRTSSTGDWNQIYSRDELAAATGWLVPAPYILNDSYTNQGLTISFDQDCALHFNDSPLVAMPAYATAEYPGWVKPDGVTTTVDNDGTIHAVAANPEAYKMKGYTIYWEASTNVPLTGMIHTDVDIPPYEGMLGYVHGQTNSSENGFYQMYSGSWTCVASSADLYAACAIQVTRNYPNQEVTSEILKFNIDNTDSVVCLYADPQYDITVNKGGVTPVTIGSGRIGSGNVMIGSGVLPEMTRGNRIIAIGQNVATDFVDSGGGSVYIGCSIVGRSDDADCLYLGNSAGADVAPDGGNNGCAYIAAGNKTILMYVDSQKFWRTREDISVLAHGAGRNIKSIYDIDSCTLWGERVVESTEAGYYLTAYGARSQLKVTMTHRVYTSVVDNGLGKARFLTTDTNDIEVGDLCLGDSINIHEVTPYGTTMTVTSVNPGVSIDFDFDYSEDFASSFLNLFDSMGNTSVGADTLNNVTRGCFNTVFGINAGYSLSNGARGNTLIGPYAGSTLPSDGRNYINLRNWKGEGLIFNSDTRKWTHDGSLITTDGFNSTFLVYDENADKYVTAKHIKAPNGFDSSLIAYDTNTNEWLLEGSIKTTDGFDSSLYNKVDAGISIVSNTWTIPDLSKSNKYSLTLSNSGNSILIDNPTTGVISGQSGVIYLTQDNTTACNITFGSNWKSMSGITGAASQTLGAKNLIRFEVQDANVIWYDYSTGGVA